MTGKIYWILDREWVMDGGVRLRKVVAHGGSTLSRKLKWPELPEEQDPGTKETSSIAMSPVKLLPLTPSNVIYEGYHESASTSRQNQWIILGFKCYLKAWWSLQVYRAWCSVGVPLNDLIPKSIENKPKKTHIAKNTID